MYSAALQNKFQFQKADIHRYSLITLNLIKEGLHHWCISVSFEKNFQNKRTPAIISSSEEELKFATIEGCELHFYMSLLKSIHPK